MLIEEESVTGGKTLILKSETNILSGNSSITEDDLHLWYGDIRELVGTINESHHLLSVKELNRAGELRFKSDRMRFLSGRIMVKKLLGTYLDAEPKKIFLRRTPFGKPYHDGHHGIHFNVSHSGNQLAIAFSVNHPVGVDVELINSSINIESLSHSYFTADEYRSIMKYDKRDRAEEFFRIWTRKESFIKGIGKGLGISLKNFNVVGNGGKIEWDHPAEESKKDWFVHDLKVKQGYKAAFATPKSDFKLSSFPLNKKFKL